MLWLILSGCAALALASMSGCTRTVFVNESTPMRVGPNAMIQVYRIVDSEWSLSEHRIPIPEGWYLVPPSMAPQK